MPPKKSRVLPRRRERRMRMFLALESIVETIAFLENLFAIRLLRASAEWGGASRSPTRVGFMGIPVLIGEPDFLLRLIDVTTTHVGVEKATGFSRHREESLAESERYPCIRIVEADEDVPPWLEKPEKILESSLEIWRVVEDARADEHVDRILCDRHGEDVPLSERDILEAETLFESLSQFQRWQAHVDANHRARLDETEEVCHLTRAAANFEDSDRWGNRPIDPEAEGAFLCLIHENSRTINIVVAGKRVSFVECLHRLPCPFLFCGYRRR